MRRREFLTVLGGAAAAWPVVARAQKPAMPVIGYLSGRRSDDSDDVVTAFRDGLRESGYVEGRNVTVEFRWSAGQYDRLPALAADLVQRRVDVIFANGGLLAALAAKNATNSTPIVFEAGTDPVRLGLVPNVNRPGGHITGVTMFSGVVLPKRMELLHEIAPSVTSIALMHNPESANVEPDTTDARTAAAALGMPIHVVHVSKPADVEPVFASLTVLARADEVIE
jgi:putative tryptophan/tyrosine transport system substrate-binding protein